jgi:ATP-binding cassette subfamily B protein/ATP-binding cassette subfamily C protein LapB
MKSAVLLFARANRRHLAEMLLATAMVNGFALAVPMFSMLIYDKAIGNEMHETLWALAAGMVLILMIEALLRYSRVLLVEHGSSRWDVQLDQRLVLGLLRQPTSRAAPVGDVVSKYRELSITRDFLSAQFLLPLADVPFLLIFVVVVAMVGGPLVWVPVLFGLGLIGISAFAHAMSYRRQLDATRGHSEKLTNLVNILMARESLSIPTAAGAAVKRFKDPSIRSARSAAKARFWSQLGGQAMPLGMTLATVTLLVAGVYRVEAQALTVGGLISVSLLSSRILGVCCSVVPIVTRWKEFSRALLDLKEWIQTEAERPAPPLHDERLPSVGALMVEVALVYPSRSEPALHKLNLELRAGELTVVVGASGSGKSSLLRLLAGHVAPSTGRLAVGGHVIASDKDRRWLAERTAYKPQDPVFLPGTLAEVVTAGRPDIAPADVELALTRAGLGPALQRGALGLNTQVGLNGQELSGGQRQMVALARAFLSGAHMLALDEPTLGLDRTAQDQVLQSLQSMKAGRCLVVTTHATEVMQIADRVLVLDGGRLVADRPPSKLLGKPGSTDERPGGEAPAKVKKGSPAARSPRQDLQET